MSVTYQKGTSHTNRKVVGLTGNMKNLTTNKNIMVGTSNNIGPAERRKAGEQILQRAGALYELIRQQQV